MNYSVGVLKDSKVKTSDYICAMDNLDIYLYIILLIVYAVARLFKASGKRASAPKNRSGNATPEPAGAQPKPQKKPFSFEDLLSEFEQSFQEKTADQPVVEEPQEEEREEVPAPVRPPSGAAKPATQTSYHTFEGTSYEDISGPVPSPTAFSSFTRDTRYAIDIREKHRIIQKIRQPGGLKDAVLLSEILNRKYF